MDWKRTLAQCMRRGPLLYPLLLWGLRTVAARFTVGASGVVFNREGEIMLLEHVFRGRHPWGLPGGWVQRRERPQDALRREIMEEVGLAVRVGPPVMVDLNGPLTHLETGFLCEVEGEVTRMSNEILAVRWVDPDTLPSNLRPLDRAMIRRALALHNQGGYQDNE